MEGAQSTSIANLSDGELSDTMRKLRYAEAAVTELIYPNSIAMLSAWVPNFANLIKDEFPPNPRSVSNWVRKYLQNGKESLIGPTMNRGNRALRFSPEIEMLTLDAVDSFVQQENRDSNDVFAYIVGKLAEMNLLDKDGTKIIIPSTRTLRRYINKLDPFLLVRIKKGVVAAEKMARAAGKMITSPRAMYAVEIDTHFLDIFVVDPDTHEGLGRPYLACAIDIRTRCIVGIYVSLYPASTHTTLSVLKDMLTRPSHGLPGGIPIYLIPDNGVEFKNSGVERVVIKLRMIFEPAEIRDPNDKPHIESFFRTLTLSLIQKIQGTTFSNPEKRGTYDSEKKAYATLGQVEEYIRDWVENVYHMRPHSQTGRIPIQMWKEDTARCQPLSLTDEEAEILIRRPYRCRINGGRVRVNKLSYYSHALKTIEETHKESVTVLVNELDLNKCYVEHPDQKGTLILAESVDPEYTRGLSKWEHEEAQRLKAEMTQKDLAAVGQYANVLARWQLMQKIQKDSQVARTKIAKLTRGKGRISSTSIKLDDTECDAVPPSIVDQPEQYSSHEIDATQERPSSVVPLDQVESATSIVPLAEKAKTHHVNTIIELE
jgi:putative transposase